MEHQTKNTNIPVAENFEFFVNITRQTLECYPKRFYSWDSYMQNYLDYVKEHVEEIIFMVKHPELDGFVLPDGETAVTYCQKEFERLYGLHVYMAYGAWAEGYFDLYAKRVREFNCIQYKDSIAHEFGEDDGENFEVEARLDRINNDLCIHPDDDDLPF